MESFDCLVLNDILLPNTQYGCCQISGITCNSVGDVIGVNLKPSNIKITGVFPDLSSLTYLENLDLSGLKIKETIPEWVGYLPNLQKIDLSQNFLYGPIPPSMINLVKLTYFNVSYNQLSGDVSFMSELPLLNGDISWITKNCWSFPPEIGNPPDYEISPNCAAPVTEENSLEIFGCNEIKRLAFKEYLWFSGRCCLIPGINCDEKGHITSISNERNSDAEYILTSSTTKETKTAFINNKIGAAAGPFRPNSVRMGFPHLKNLNFLEQLDLHGLEIDDGIPDWLGNFKNLQRLDLSGNRIQGPIPKSFTNLKQLKSLDVSGNLITGTIGFLASLPFLRLSTEDVTENCFNFPENGFTPLGYKSSTACPSPIDVNDLQVVPGIDLRPPQALDEQTMKTKVDPIAPDAPKGLKLPSIELNPGKTRDENVKITETENQTEKNSLFYTTSTTTTTITVSDSEKTPISERSIITSIGNEKDDRVSDINGGMVTTSANNHDIMRLFGIGSQMTATLAPTSYISLVTESRVSAIGITSNEGRDTDVVLISVVVTICVFIAALLCYLIGYRFLYKKFRKPAKTARLDAVVIPSPKASDDPYDWSNTQIEDWLVNNQYPENVIQIFKDCQIGGKTFLRLSEHDLKIDLGVPIETLAPILQSIEILRNLSVKFSNSRIEESLPTYIRE